jgi:hypothetical protein
MLDDQPYLPQAYVESDSDSTSCFLFFQRLGMKADLINSVVAQAHGLPDALSGPVSDLLVGVCEVKHLMTSAIAKSDMDSSRCVHVSHRSLLSASVSRLSSATAMRRRSSALDGFTPRSHPWRSESICTSTYFDGRSSGRWSVLATSPSKFIC